MKGPWRCPHDAVGTLEILVEDQGRVNYGPPFRGSPRV